jgi:hypothetical protein
MLSTRVVFVLLTVLFVGYVHAEVSYPSEPINAEVTNDVEDVGVFYDALAPYGTWISLQEYGQVWAPSGVPVGWRPYTDGRWVYTDYGWTWVSDWEWGWAPFHYGRWTYVSAYGWVWIPGRVWAPAWVAWRHGPGWVGWAPLPPYVVFPPSGVITHVEVIPHFWFAFVEERWLIQPHIHTYIVPPARNIPLISVTRNVTSYAVVQKRVVNNGIPVQRIERVTAQPVPRLRVVQQDVATATRQVVVKDKEREVVVYRPQPGVTTHLTDTTSRTATAPTQSTPVTVRQGQPQEESPTNLQPAPGQPQRPRTQSPGAGEFPERLRRQQAAVPQEPRGQQTPRQPQVQQQPFQPPMSPPPASPQPSVGPRRPHQQSEPPLVQQPPRQQAPPLAAQPLPLQSPNRPLSSFQQQPPQPAYTPQNVMPPATQQQRQQRILRPESPLSQQQ